MEQREAGMIHPDTWFRRLSMPSAKSWLSAGNLIAGVSVGAYLIPQAMAYGTLAGVGAAVGLAVAVIPLLVYTILGTHKWVSVGPESAVALMAAAAAAGYASETGVSVLIVLPTMAFLVGIILLLARLLKASFLADLLSLPVLVGYLTGVAVLMILSQLPKITGIKMNTDTIWTIMKQTQWSTPDWATVGIGVGVALIAWFTPKVSRRFPGTLAALALAIPAGMLLDVPTIGTVSTAIPHFTIPNLSWSMVSHLLGPAAAVAAVAYADVLIAARALNDGHRVDPGREMVALAGSQIGTGLFGGYPVSASTSRTALARAAGATSKHYSLVVAALLVVAPLLLGSVLAKIPVAALAGVIVYAAVSLIEIKDWKLMNRLHRSEMWIAAGCAAAVLAFGILPGIGIAIAGSVLAFLARMSRPTSSVLGFVPYSAGMHNVEEKWGTDTIDGLVVFRYNAPLFFINASDFFTKALNSVDENTNVLLINMETSANLDTTSLETLRELAEHLQSLGIELWLARTKHDVIVLLDRHGCLTVIGHHNLHPTLPTAVAEYLKRHPNPAVIVPEVPKAPPPETFDSGGLW